MMEELVQKRPDMMKEADNILGWTPLHYAAFYGGVESVEILIKYDVNSSTAYFLDHDGNSALHLAALKGHLDVIKELLQSCPDIFELTNKKGQTALHLAIRNEMVKVVEYVLGNPQLGGLLNEPDGDGNTPLHLAVLFDQKQIIELLLAKDKRVDVNATNKDNKAAPDIYLLNFRKPGFKAMKIKSLFKERSFARSAQHIFPLLQDDWINRKDELKPYFSGLKEHREEHKKIFTNFPVVFLIMATLILTVSVSVAFTMPGNEKGKPIIADKAGFKAFVILDIVAFSCSFVVVLFQHHAATSEHLRARYHNFQSQLLFIAILALAFAFASGIHVKLVESSSILAMATYVILLCIIVIFKVCWLVDPFGGRYYIRIPFRSGKYHFQFQFGGSTGIFPRLSLYTKE